MSHVDDGALHAYLDGALENLPAVEAEAIRAHLAQCEVCLSRLEEERSLRAEAMAILAGGTPDLGEIPSFEDVRARAGRAAAPSPMSRLRRLGWAASVVVAAGSGWLLRGSRAPSFDVPRETVVEADAVNPTGQAAREAPSAPPARPIPAASEDQAASGERAGPEVRAKSAPDPVRRSEAAAAPDRLAGAGALDEVVASPGTAAGSTSAVASGVAPATDTGATGVPALNALGVRTAVEEKEAVRASPRADVADVTRPLADRRMEVPSVATAAAVRQRAAESPTPVAFADVNALTGVPGLPVIPTAEVDPTLPLGAVRTLQLLSGDTLELIHLPAGQGPPTLERRPGDDRTEVVVPRGRGWLVGRAHMTEDALRTLLSRVPGGG